MVLEHSNKKSTYLSYLAQKRLPTISLAASSAPESGLS